MALPESFLQELTARCDIYDIVSRYVKLKKSGSNYFGLCPFHNEKTPSFSVSRDKQIYHCFGCGAGGGVINFVMQMENMTFPEAVRHLAAQVGMEVPEDTGASYGEKRKRLIALCTESARFYVEKLYSPEGKQGLSYLLGRGLSPGTLKHFGLGFAPDSWDSLIHAMTQKGFTKGEMLECGLVVQNKSGGVYDRFRNRVMFPIIDIQGRVIAFGGRVMDDSMPKYLNSSDTPVFQKSQNLFAMNFAKKSKGDFFLLAEGYMDVIALHQAGFQSAVASLGTSLTKEQARLMASRGKEQVIICYDSDEAGKKAAQRAIDLLTPTGLKVRVLRMSGAKDPDEYIRKNGPGAFRDLLEKSDSDIQYRLSEIAARFDLEETEDRVEFLQQTALLLCAIPSAVEREIFSRQAAEKAGVSPESMLEEVERQRKRRAWQQKAQQERQAMQPARAAQPAARELRYDNVRSARREEGLVALLFSHGELLDRVSSRLQPEQFSSPFLGKIYELLLKRRQQGEETSLGLCMSLLSPEEGETLARLVAKEPPVQDPQRALEDYLSVIEMEYIKKKNQTEEQDDAALLELAQRRLRRQQERGGM